MSGNLPGASRYFGTYKNNVLIFIHNYSSMLGIERVARPKQELIENFLSGETVDELNEGSDGATAMRTQSSQLVLLSNIVLQSHDQFKKLKMYFQKALKKERKLFLL